eukprot:scaffold201941_cov14-Prasinocladus_malaysianus.AAC.1
MTDMLHQIKLATHEGQHSEHDKMNGHRVAVPSVMLLAVTLGRMNPIICLLTFLPLTHAAAVFLAQ